MNVLKHSLILLYYTAIIIFEINTFIILIKTDLSVEDANLLHLLIRLQLQKHKFTIYTCNKFSSTLSHLQPIIVIL